MWPGFDGFIQGSYRIEERGKEIRDKKKNGWEEIYPEEINTKKQWPAHLTLRPKYGTIYFSIRLVTEFFGTSNRVRIRYNKKAGILAFTPTSDSEHSYKISSGNRTIKAKNVFNRIKISFVENKSFFTRYNSEARWLEINLNKEIKGKG